MVAARVHFTVANTTAYFASGACFCECRQVREEFHMRLIKKLQLPLSQPSDFINCVMGHAAETCEESKDTTDRR